MKLLLPFKGTRMDFQVLTAIPEMVRKGKKFKGKGTDQTQTGTLPEVSAVKKELPLNGKYVIPAGLHDNESIVEQTTLSVMEGATIYPTGEAQTINTTNKYMNGDILVSALSGLVPGNIKKGVTILGVTGTYEGYS